MSCVVHSNIFLIFFFKIMLYLKLFIFTETKKISVEPKFLRRLRLFTRIFLQHSSLQNDFPAANPTKNPLRGACFAAFSEDFLEDFPSENHHRGATSEDFPRESAGKSSPWSTSIKR